jgi:diaminopimelate epimerase
MLENHPIFPERANITLAQVTSPDSMVIRTWERGAGLTKACGSAACASVVAAARTNRTGRSVRLQAPGGELHVEWRGDDHVVLTGAAEWEFGGTFDPATGAWSRAAESAA